MDSIDENFLKQLIIDERKTHNEASEVLKSAYPGVRGFSARSVRRFCKEKGISTKVNNEELTGLVRSSVRVVSQKKKIHFL